MADIDIYKAKLPQDDTNLYRFRDGVIEPLVDTSYEETEYANPLTLETLQAQTAKNTKIKLEPIQDLHGYSKPWVGGAGKNLIDLNAFSSTSAVSRVVDGNKVTMTADGTSGNYQSCSIGDKNNLYFPAGTYYLKAKILSIQNTNVSMAIGLRNYSNTFIGAYNITATGTIEKTITINESCYFSVLLNSTEQDKANQIVFENVILSTVDVPFEPYSNICPISGHDQIDILGCGKNLCDLDSVRIGIAWNDTHNSDRATVLTPILGNATYTLKVNAPNNMFDGNQFYVVQKDANNVVVSTGLSVANNTAYTFTAEQTAILFIVQFNKTNIAKTDFANTTVQLEAGSEATEYVPYAGQSNNLSIDIPSTVYGGVLDLESGELVVESGLKTFVGADSETWSTRTSGDIRLFEIRILETYVPQTTAQQGLTNRFSYDVQMISGDYCYRLMGDILSIRMPSDMDTTAKFKTWLASNNVQLWYPLKDTAKFTLYISPEHLKLLKAQNTITTSQYTQIKVTYRNGVFATLEELSDTAQDIYDEISGDSTTVSGNPLNFTTREKQKSKSTIIDLEPIQDLHGFTKPWVGGAGKNLLPMTVEGLKAANTSGTWSGNVYSGSGMNYELVIDESNNIINIHVYGSTETYPEFRSPKFNLPVGTYTLYPGNRCRFYENDTRIYDGSNETTFTVSDTTAQYQYAIFTGKVSSVDKNVTPFIYVSTETSTTFEPYTNIASISGRSSVDIDGCGKNLIGLPGGWDNYGVLQPTASAIRSELIAAKQGDTYIASKSQAFTTAWEKVYVLLFDANNNFISQVILLDYGVTQGVIYTVPSNVSYIAFSLYLNATDLQNIDLYHVQVEKGSVCSLFEPYTPSTDLTISFGTTVYGGRLNVEKGELVVDRGYESTTWGDMTYPADRGNNITSKRLTLSSVSIPSSEKKMSICNVTNYEVYNTNGIIHFYINETGQLLILFLPNTTSESANIQICYPLATPQTIQLTPQQVQLLKGINNISTTGTTITVTFKNGSVAHLDDLPENVFTDLDKEKLASIDTLAVTLDLLTHSIIVTQDV